MLRPNHNILGFLQKKEFFQHSNKSLSPRQNSRFTKQPYLPPPTQARTPAKPTANTYFDPDFNASTAISKPIKELQKSRMNTNPTDNTPKRSDLLIYASKRQILFPDKVEREMHESKESYTREKSTSKGEGMQSHSRIRQNYNPPPPPRNRNFQSSKIESKMCLQDLHHRVSMELSLTEKIIAELTTSMESRIYHQLNQLKTDIMRMVDETFNEARLSLDSILQRSKDEQLKEVLQLKYRLKQKDGVLKDMKYQMEVNWRKIAGDLLTNETDKEIESVIHQSMRLRERFNTVQFEADTPTINAPKESKWASLNSIKQITKQMIASIA